MGTWEDCAEDNARVAGEFDIRVIADVRPERMTRKIVAQIEREHDWEV